MRAGLGGLAAQGALQGFGSAVPGQGSYTGYSQGQSATGPATLPRPPPRRAASIGSGLGLSLGLSDTGSLGAVPQLQGGHLSIAQRKQLAAASKMISTALPDVQQVLQVLGAGAHGQVRS